LFPLREHGTKTIGDVGPLVSEILPFAHVLAQVENKYMVGIDNQLPVAAANCAHAAIADVRPPVKRALDRGRPSLENRKQIDAIVVGRYGRA
jgi:hypothetical protein